MIDAIAVSIGHSDDHIVARSHDFAAFAHVFLQNGIVLSLCEGAKRIVGSGITYSVVLSAIVVRAIHYIICVAFAEQIAAFRPTPIHLTMRGASALPFALLV